MTAEIIKLGPHERMTPEEALASAAQEQWQDIIVVGYHVNNPTEIMMQTSHMNRETALWIVEWAKKYIMDGDL